MTKTPAKVSARHRKKVERERAERLRRLEELLARLRARETRG